ncbi:MAG: flagellar motor protein MotB [Bdellovibrionaceae bacterium]|nr:flagellar motor protein MotB [Pseudobdellovibrionaceae bacterium]
MSSVKKVVEFDNHIESDSDEVDLFVNDSGGAKHDDSESIWLLSYADMMTLLMGFFALLTSMATFEPETFKEVGGGAAEYFGGETDNKFKELGEILKQVIEKKGLSEQVQIKSKMTEVMISFEGTLFFDSGSILLKNSAESLMQEIIVVLEEKAKNNKYLIEGHTDDIPIEKGIVASNWELSALRAGAVARLFEKNGFSRDNIMTIGWGENRPLKANRDTEGNPIKENQDANRRVVLKILNKHPI